MTNKRLTKRVVEAVEPGDQDTILWDSELAGFGCKITPTGRRSYFVKYRVGGGRNGTVRKPTIGQHGIFTPNQAREIARDWLSKARKGEDPSGQRQAARIAPTVFDLCDRYLTEHAIPHKKPSSIASDRRLIKANVLPSLGRSKVAEVTRAEVGQLHHAMRSTPYEANRTLALLSKMFNLSEVWGYRPDGSNPCRHVKRFREHRRERFFSEDELQNLGAALKVVERSGSELPGVIAAIRLLAFTGCRLGEILTLQWENVDLERGAFTLVDAKAGGRIVPLGTAALTTFATIESTGPFVVHGPNADRPLSRWTFEKAWSRIRDRAGLSNARPHDLRHTVGTYAGQAGLNAFMVRDLLGHKTLAMTDRYVERDTDPMRTAADHVSARIAAAMDESAGANVVDLRQRR